MENKQMEYVKTRVQNSINIANALIAKFKADIEKNGIAHTIQWMGEEAMAAETNLQKYTVLLNFLNSDRYSFDELKAERERCVNQLVRKPWRHNSTNPMANIESSVKAEVLADFVDKLDEILIYLKEY